MPHTGIGFLDQTELRWYDTVTQGWDTDTMFVHSFKQYTERAYLTN